MFDKPQPSLIFPEPERPFARRSDGTTISLAHFQADVAAVAERLPDLPYALNLCEDRYRFTVALVAAASRRQACLLPASRAEEDIDQAAQAFKPSYRLRDDVLADAIGTGGAASPVRRSVDPLSCIDDDQVVAVPFTSGSTGRSQPHPKRWGDLVAGAHLAERRFGFVRQGVSAIVATVPAQHMYGLEVSVLVPLVVGVGVHGGRPFFPADIRRALADAGPWPVLVTTPIHLSACIEANLDWPPVAFVISATATLPVEIARQAEAALSAPVMEIFGFTEAGSIASRRSVGGPLWQLYDGIRLRDRMLEAAHLPAPVPLNDVIDVVGPDRFALVGRAQDLVNVAGKRTSLAHLNRVLCGIAGVVDGAFVVPDEEVGIGNGRLAAGGGGRIAAVVVAPDLRREEVLAALAPRIDPLFMPRPLLMVDRLPRNDNGKLPRRAMLELLQATVPRRTHG